MKKILHYEREILEQVTLTSKQIMIVETYLKLSNKIGVADMTIQKLADEMNVSIGSVHYHFGAKGRPNLEQTAVKYVSQESIKFINYYLDKKLTSNEFKGVESYIEIMFDWAKRYPHQLKFWLYFLYQSTHHSMYSKMSIEYVPLMQMRIEHVIILGAGLGIYPQVNNVSELAKNIHANLLGHIFLSGMYNNGEVTENSDVALSSTKQLIKAHLEKYSDVTSNIKKLNNDVMATL
ncbi:MAG: TetR/AcrR family transcriptional regulator [Bacteriovoracaceae bacterium]|jgi:AcrR family transcriptional regulator|nr:TetR/AcrR family transcriptional regulator [Bacteriovoracaceae bacterium]